jgi:hypothetical protein
MAGAHGDNQNRRCGTTLRRRVPNEMITILCNLFQPSAVFIEFYCGNNSFSAFPSTKATLSTQQIGLTGMA